MCAETFRDRRPAVALARRMAVDRGQRHLRSLARRHLLSVGALSRENQCGAADRRDDAVDGDALHALARRRTFYHTGDCRWRAGRRWSRWAYTLAVSGVIPQITGSSASQAPAATVRSISPHFPGSGAGPIHA